MKGWGGYPIASADVFRPERIGDLIQFVHRVKGTYLARGAGTSYGDASINNEGINIDMRRLNKMFHFSLSSTKLWEYFRKFCWYFLIYGDGSKL